MPSLILIIFLFLAATLLTQVLVLIPLNLLTALSLPNWLTWAAIALVVFWCFGE
jgi:hypothetical protein